MDFAFFALVLILPVSALAARRLPLGQTAKLAVTWLAIFAIAFALVALWQGATRTGAMLDEVLR